MLAIVAVGAVLVTAMVWSSARTGTSGHTLGERPDKVVIFGIPRLTLADVNSTDMPALSRLAAEGSIGAASTVTPTSEPSPTAAYATLGAGVPVVGAATGGDARMADAQVGARTAAEVGQRRPGTLATGQVVVLGGPAVVAATPRHVTSRPGALGTRLRHHRRPVAVLANSDARDAAGRLLIDRPAALALMDSRYWLNAGNVRGLDADGPTGPALLREDANAPFGLRSDPEVFGRETTRLLRRADVLVVDPGEMDRADLADPTGPGGTDPGHRRGALARTDDVLGRVAAALPPRTLLLVVGVTPPDDNWDLTPVVAHGSGVRPGYLVSPSTHRLGIVTISDIGPTVLGALRLGQPVGMTGNPLRYHDGPASLNALKGVNRLASLRGQMQPPATLSFILAQVVVYAALILLLLWRRKVGAAAAWFRFAVLAFAAWPLATYLYRVLPSGLQLGSNGQLVVWALAALLAVTAGRFRSPPLRSLQVLCGLTVVVILVDLATGARLQLSSVLGYSPQTGGRFTGIGNLGFTVLAATAIIAGLVHVQHALPARRHQAMVATGVLFALVIVGDGWPTLGGDVGGTLTLLPVLGGCLYVLTGRRLRGRNVLLAIAGAVALAGAMAALDLVRAPADRTHLGRFVADAFRDPSTLSPVLARKWSGVIRPFQVSLWTWTVPVLSIAALYLLAVRGAATQLLPARSPQRTAVVAILLIGLVGGLVNDSGVAITALALAYVGPFVTLTYLALDEPELERPDPAPAAAASPAVLAR